MSNIVKARFIVCGFDCEHDEITARVGLEPTKIWLAGQPRAQGVTITHKENGWAIDLLDEEATETEPIVLSLLSVLDPAKEAIRDLSAAYHVEVSCVVRAEDFVPALSFQPETVNQIAELGAALDIDLYCLTEDES